MPSDKKLEFRSIILTGQNGDEMRCSAIFHRDSGFLSYNRISLLADNKAHTGFMRLSGGEIQFRFIERKDGGRDQNTLSGRGYFTKFGVTRSGPGVDDESLHEAAELIILEYHDVHQISGDGEPRLYMAITVLQPTVEWPQPSMIQHWNGAIERRGYYIDRWSKPRGFDLRFRLATQYMHQDLVDGQFGQERFWLPAIEIEPAPGIILLPATFHERAEKLWFNLKILAAFFFKKQMHQAMRTELSPGRIAIRHWPERLHRDQREKRHEPPFWDIEPAKFFARAMTTIQKTDLDLAHLHGAVFSYTDALSQNTLESAITSYVEGIERLLEIVEKRDGILREVIVDNDEIKQYRCATKTAINSLDFLTNRKEDRAVMRTYLKNVPVLNLEGRIKRFERKYAQSIGQAERQLFEELGELIKLRNDIVHGRMVKDFDVLHRECRRGQAIFEKMFLCLVGCGNISVSTREFLAANTDR